MTDSKAINVTNAGRSIVLDISEPFTLTETSDSDPGDWQRIHPVLMRLPSGRLVAQVNRDGDIPDNEQLVFVSDDDGASWRETTNWPTSNKRGQHVKTHLINLPDGESLVVYAYALFATDDPERCILPTWRTTDSGETWSDMQGAGVRFKLDAPLNIYDRPNWFADRFKGTQHALKDDMPPAVAAMATAFGEKRSFFIITSSHVFDDGRVLLFAYGNRPNVNGHARHETYVLESTDRGRSWQHLATPGKWEDRLQNEFFLKHATDGLCEPAVTAVGDNELLCVMRLGSRHPLYQTRSRDGGRTWSSPAGMPVYGILPSLVTLDDGAVLLCSGRPDATLSISTDSGERWPMTYRFLEDGKPLDPSTRNNTMIKIGPQRVMYLYDYGGYHQLPDGFPGKARIVGHIIEAGSGS